MMKLQDILKLLPEGWEASYKSIGDESAREVEFRSPRGDFYMGDTLTGSPEMLTLTGNLRARISIGAAKAVGEDDLIQIAPANGIATLKGQWEVELYKTPEQGLAWQPAFQPRIGDGNPMRW
ncbi:hypothetical protein OKA04_23525 [Luteolibacter flavescens]|uniref:Uncharacterized protein n=1 Tax=Luteolibacter flavescens TaxID=1859460 RepID=A0ABT3FVV0_9BACT|nr:hypothetical protein [Luteolibacter flavescens]MCW1887728.1 hypothetical protein [Luteolibacter flavescens]